MRNHWPLLQKLQENNRKSFTLIEVLFVSGLIAVVIAAVYPHFRVANMSWQAADRRMEVIQNARVGMDKMVTALRGARSFTSVTAPGVADGRIVFLDKNGNTVEFLKYNDGSHDMLGYVSGGNTSTLAGPITSLTFTCYKSDGVTTTTVAAEIRSVEIALTVSDAEGAVAAKTMTSRASYRNE